MSEYVAAIEQEFAADRRRDRDFLQDVAERYAAPLGLIESLARAYDARATVTESYERGTMPTSITDSQANAVAGAVRLHGARPRAVAAIARVLTVSEAVATDIARRISESFAAPSATAAPAAAPSDLAAMDSNALRQVAGDVFGDAFLAGRGAREAAPRAGTVTESEDEELQAGLRELSTDQLAQLLGQAYPF